MRSYARILSVSALLTMLLLQSAIAADLPVGETSPPESVVKRVVADATSFRHLPSQSITEDTTLSGNLLVDGFITVLPQATLTVLPGAVLRFAADSGILVFGRIALVGSADAPVRLISNYIPANSADWVGINLLGTEKINAFEHVSVSGAETAINASFSSFSARNLTVENSDTAVRLVDSTAVIKDAVFTLVNTGISVFKGELELERAAFENNRDGLKISSSSLSAADLTFAANRSVGFSADNAKIRLDRGLFLSNKIGAKIAGSEGRIVNSLFRNSNESAIVLSASAVRFSANIVTGGGVGVVLEDNISALWGNSLSGNSHYNLLYLGKEKFSAGGNWFGSNSEAEVRKGVYSKQPGALSIKPLLETDPLTKPEIQQLRKRR